MVQKVYQAIVPKICRPGKLLMNNGVQVYDVAMSLMSSVRLLAQYIISGSKTEKCSKL